MHVAVIIPEHPNSRPLSNFPSDPGNTEKFWFATEEKDVNKFVIGYPISMNYKENEMTKIIDSFKQDMENLDFEVILEDERLSSEYAKKIMIEQDIKVSRNKEMVDLTAASIILQTYLDRNKNQ